MEYIIVTKFTMKGIVEEVNRLIQEGWKPQGGILLISQGNYYQAMIKENK